MAPKTFAERSAILPVFPLELWDIIIEYLRDEESAQHLSRLAQSCATLYERINPQLYNSVRLFNSESGARLAYTIEKHPELAPLIREIRHKQDAGQEFWSHRHFQFYRTAATLPNLEKLSLRKNPRPFDSTRWGNKAARDEAMLQWVGKVASGSATVKEYRELGFGPLEESSFSPPVDELAHLRGRVVGTLFLHASLAAPPGLPALRVCHIGSDYNHDEHNPKMDGTCLPLFNETLFRHPGLRKLCVTGATFQFSQPGIPAKTTSSPLEELTLLNCIINPGELETVLDFPKALKRFTFRGPRSHLVDPGEEPLCYVHSTLAHESTLEYMDYDLYWGGDEETDFGELVNLKHLTTTLATLTGMECMELDPLDDTLPPNLESLTIRYDEVKSWLPSAIYEMVKDKKLAKLRRFTCEVPDIIEHLPSINEDKFNPSATEICQEGNTWKSKFAELNVDMSMVSVPYPLELPRYDVCACECLPYYHRMFYHPRKPLVTPWEENEGEEDVFFDDWADVDDEFDLDILMDDLAEESGSDASA
ncbi:hypothetical protein N7491_006844 [Penicillium cf. griseofulvum]|uniref:F-box domain-containing protein n=1 Tax=Penicillium cf. griseofulvum TaxID=2972120 RepID=A0A9W9IV12_9EURO|nr:hypothetical protein N7472_010125 [Penicillium cf. griseofulvum]KAJ5429828.1 hypothetical protein N7491_006844 [Penicillium cf. griseofulvum]KAJ5436402.1 hypothetical protein N7445_007287 [Penicillium cf. griseofulvum]